MNWMCTPPSSARWIIFPRQAWKLWPLPRPSRRKPPQKSKPPAPCWKTRAAEPPRAAGIFTLPCRASRPLPSAGKIPSAPCISTPTATSRPASTSMCPTGGAGRSIRSSATRASGTRWRSGTIQALRATAPASSLIARPQAVRAAPSASSGRGEAF